ncbi:MAG: SPASM domain-containing protein [Eubacterium sp.]|nr:SPASM domain-containing protein [Eubacterium sp.]
MFGKKKELECIRKEYLVRLKAMGEAHVEELKALDAKHHQELESLDKKCRILDKKLEALNDAHEAELEAMQKGQDAQIKSLQQAQEEQMQGLQEEKEAQIQALYQESERLKEKCEALQADNDRVYAGHRGLEEEIHFLKYRAQTLDKLHESVVLGNWPHDGSFREYTCRNPFENIEILSRGEVYTCCSAYIKHNYDIGNIFKENFQEIWNSKKARRLRQSVQEGNFEFCQKYCKFLHEAAGNGKNGTDNPVVLKKDAEDLCQPCQLQGYVVKHTPKHITLSCDETCNLRCPTCRSSGKGLNAKESDRLYERLVKVVTPMLKECRMLTALGSGEVFASSAVSRFLKTITAQEFPNLKLAIITNLQLADEKKWKEFSNLSYIPKIVKVSIDAACGETYEENRRGGDCPKTMN